MWRITTFLFLLLMFIVSCGKHDLVSQTELNDQVSSQTQANDNPACTTDSIEVRQGLLCGNKVKTSSGKIANSYLGIPYAQSTENENRWKPPKPIEVWSGIFKATEFGPICPQITKKDLYQSEDCLSLNVWVPDYSDGKVHKLPVIVFIHGGVFIEGSSADPLYDGSYLSANEGVIVVSMNYRLGVLGFLAGLNDKATGEILEGNYGLLDQQLALKWVKKNITSFGGDPDKITLFGESSGAMSVGIHSVSFPSSRGLFRAAIMESNPFGIPYKTIEESKPFAKHFTNNIGCEHDDIACMRKKPIEDVLISQTKKSIWPLVFNGLKDFLTWAPVVDDRLFTIQPIKSIEKGKLKIPLITGTNKQEGILFVELTKNGIGKKKLSTFDYHLVLDILFRDYSYRKIIRDRYPAQSKDNSTVLSDLLTDYLFTCSNRYVASKNKKSTWAYEFDQVSSFNILPKIPSCTDAVCHGDELPYVFHSAENDGYSFDEAEEELSVLIQKYWSDFAKYRDPDKKDKNWPSFGNDNYHIVFDTPINKIAISSNYDSNCDLWDEVGYDLEEHWWDLL